MEGAAGDMFVPVPLQPAAIARRRLRQRHIAAKLFEICRHVAALARECCQYRNMAGAERAAAMVISRICAGI
ncbi:hypothetical protein GCM10010520_59590 [Rhizobium viscosum]